MTLDIVNEQNVKVGSLELSDEVFAGRPNADLIWSAVVREQASGRRGTHATKNRALVAGSGRKLWRQKGTGRARVGELRNPLWRKGGTVFGPRPRSYDFQLPRKMERGALRAALAARLQEGAVIAVDALEIADAKTRSAAGLLSRLGATGKTLVVDVKPDERVERAMRNLASARLVTSGRATARDLVDCRHVVVTRAALEYFERALGGSAGAAAVPQDTESMS